MVDSYALGAYSYPSVRQGKEQKLQTEYQKTLYLAGEVFHTEMSGTVEGALNSGKDAAKKILTKLRVSV